MDAAGFLSAASGAKGGIIVGGIDAAAGVGIFGGNDAAAAGIIGGIGEAADGGIIGCPKDDDGGGIDDTADGGITGDAVVAGGIDEGAFVAPGPLWGGPPPADGNPRD